MWQSHLKVPHKTFVCVFLCTYMGYVCASVQDVCLKEKVVLLYGTGRLFSPSQGRLSLGISVAAPAIIIPCLLLIADTAGSQ